MKAAFLLATVLVFASSTSALFHFRATASDVTVDVGNLDTYDAVLQHFHDSSDGFSILSDKEYRTDRGPCTFPWDHDTVNVNIEGKWGNEGELGHEETGTALLEAMGAYMEHVKARSDWTRTIFTDCQWNSLGIPPWKGGKAPTCGARSHSGPWDCPCPTGLCYGKTTGYKFPRKISIALYDKDDKLMADELAVTFTANNHHRPGGCGAGPWDEYLRGTLSFIPILGQFIDRGILMFCAN